MSSRVKIKLPSEEPLFITNYTLTVQDMNYGNHMGNDRVLSIAHEARLQFFKSFGFDELNFFGSSLIMADAAIQYKGQGFRGDNLSIKMWIAEGARGFDLYYHFIKIDTLIEVARLKTALIFFDYKKETIERPPQEFTKTMKDHFIIL